jgi:uncharacterized lipoprotein YajG
MLKKSLLCATTFAMLAGCSNIGTVNGVPVGVNAATQSQQTYCAQNPAICIIGGAVAIGVIAKIADNDSGGGTPGTGNGGGGGF